jgi:macrolide-specific efflux system membrane fusion protein
MKNKMILVFVIGVVGILSFIGWRKFVVKGEASEAVRVIHPKLADIQTVISTTGTVLPKNRLEMHPSVSGRIEQVLVKEGQQVKAGDIVVVMSSTDRAALLDAARGQGEEVLKYWQDVYKPIPLAAPINGQVIVGTVQPGQTVSSADAVIVLSDRLIVRAQVDETDIGKVKDGQAAVVTLDAYQDVKINAVVDHIYYESKTVNNVTQYMVDLIPETVPDFFRSGMNANVDLVQCRLPQ